MSADAACFPFVQLDVPGRIGIDDGRYLLRAGSADEGETVLVVQTAGAPPAARRVRLRRHKPQRADADADATPVPVTRLTVIPARPVDRGDAKRALEKMTADPGATEDAIAESLQAVNRVMRAHRIANQDPYGHEIGRETPLLVRVGYGTGQELADGRWEDAFEVAPPERRRRRAQALRPQERLARLLAGREEIDACETLVLRARADLDQGRPREAALQLAAGLEALLAELPERAGPEQEQDLATLRERRELTGSAAQEAVHGELSAEQADEVAETLRICERVLRRRQALRS